VTSSFCAGWSPLVADAATTCTIGGILVTACMAYPEIVLYAQSLTRYLAKLHVMLQKEYARRSNDA
jgi:hypothetical protein